MKNKIIILNPYFLPGYRAGGPIQSLSNMIELLYDTFDFFVITSANDMGCKKIYKDIVPNTWQNIQYNECSIKVWYLDNGLTRNGFKNIVNSVSPKYIFINGLYTFSFFGIPITLANYFFKKGITTVISPRGMLQKGALEIKPLKKKIYLNAIKILGFTKNIKWHATTIDELKDIKENFGDKSIVSIAANIPKKPLEYIKENRKQENTLRLVYLSLITEKKNLLLTISAIKQCKQQIYFDIYGPITDELYWKKCKYLLSELPSNISITYKGLIEPFKVQNTLQAYDAMILLTKGENFGHALFESLSVGTPILTSFFTPWKNLEDYKAGWNIDIAKTDKEVADYIDRLATFSDMKWESFELGALKTAKEYYTKSSNSVDYRIMFQ